MSLGILRIEVVEAHLKRDTDFFGKMDPFCFMRVREATWKSQVCNGGGKNPKWQGQVFAVDVKYFGDDLFIDIRDDDVTGTDNVGENTIKLSSLIIQDRGINEWFELQYKGKSAGRVHLICEW